jgi:hypothetical protein
MHNSKEWPKTDYLKRLYIGYLLEEGKEGHQKQNGKKAYSKLWKNVVYKVETGK